MWNRYRKLKRVSNMTDSVRPQHVERSMGVSRRGFLAATAAGGAMVVRPELVSATVFLQTTSFNT